jgi:uncharacterized HAD superfamily protein
MTADSLKQSGNGLVHELIFAGRHWAEQRPLIGVTEAGNPRFHQHRTRHDQVMHSRPAKARFNLQHLSAIRAENLLNPVSALRSPLQSFQNHYLQRSLQHFHSVLVLASSKQDGATLHVCGPPSGDDLGPD